MNLILRRDQSSSLNRVFMLWGKLELTETEKTLIDRYELEKAVLVATNRPQLNVSTGVVATAVFLVTDSLFAAAKLSNQAALVCLCLCLGLGAGFWHYQTKREVLFVRDLILGRYFFCGSVVELARKEAWLKDITSDLIYVLKGARHWEGTETVPISEQTTRDHIEAFRQAH